MISYYIILYLYKKTFINLMTLYDKKTNKLIGILKNELQYLDYLMKIL